MKTLLEYAFPGPETHPQAELLELADMESDRCKNAGDLLGMGEWQAAKIPYLSDEDTEGAFARLVSLWASTAPVPFLPPTVKDLLSRIDQFVPESISLSFARAVLWFSSRGRGVPEASEKVAFRLLEPLRKLFGLDAVNPKSIAQASARRLGESLGKYHSSVDSFLRTSSRSAADAKAAAIRVIRMAREELKHFLLPAEAPLMDDVGQILGPQFRNFCDACVRRETELILLTAPGLRDALVRFTPDRDSTLWMSGMLPLVRHALKLSDEAVRQYRAAASPSLRLGTSIVKVDLRAGEREVRFSCRLINVGDGQAYALSLAAPSVDAPVSLTVVSPRGPFDIPGKAEQIVSFALTCGEARTEVSVPLEWRGTTLLGESYAQSTPLKLAQQSTEPDWAALEETPPYSLKPVRIPEHLVGRGTILKELLLNAAQGKSTFLWGQKRVGKTSLLQVMVAELRNRPHFVCVFLRMGELRGHHEGQVAHTIARRLCQEASYDPASVPPEDSFRSGLGRLIPYVERFLRQAKEKRLVCVIDEFDDFDAAFYTGERGKQFVKALRSLSEEGLTFFFAGSERMNAIHARHQLELNVWANLFVDRIESLEDAKDLVTRPVLGKIEYQPEAVEHIVRYCGSNPFYLHLFCSKILASCLQERRTYVAETDLPFIQERLVREASEANFAHFWLDTPDLDDADRARHGAENCLVLACAAQTAGPATLDELMEAQRSFELDPGEHLGSNRFREAVDRLRTRQVLLAAKPPHAGKFEVALPLLWEWLRQAGHLLLLNRWRAAHREMLAAVQPSAPTPVVPFETAFPIAEDDLLAVSTNLVYCGKQKDVAELRVWLRQFDDDVRIELAFQILKRLAEKGYVSDGARTYGLGKLEEMIGAKCLEGEKAWRLVRGKKDNLCLSFVDGETKSGAELARDLAKRMRPGKVAGLAALRTWVAQHANDGSVLAIVDDFSGTGSTVSKGIETGLKELERTPATRRFLEERRIACFLLYAFPEARQMLAEKHPMITFQVANVFGSEVRVEDPDAGIFSDENELKFACEMLLQIGRDLYREHPLGHGNLGGLVCFHDIIPNNTLPIFWSNGVVGEKPWRPLFPRK